MPEPPAALSGGAGGGAECFPRLMTKCFGIKKNRV